jgi:DNA-binding response OmpR family regulator
MEDKKISILLVEDDVNLGVVVRDYLMLSGYQVDLEGNGESGWKAFSRQQYDLCILDVMLPERDGFSLAEMIRKEDKQIPLLFLTAKASQEDILKGYRTGADDYIIKPFNIEVLVLRIEVFLKRSKNISMPKSVFEIGKYNFDYHNLSLGMNGKIRILTQMEADLLRNLCIHKEEVLRREEILTSVWGDHDYFTGRSLDVFISRLRKYLKDDPEIEIQNFHAVGFRLTTTAN